VFQQFLAFWEYAVSRSRPRGPLTAILLAGLLPIISPGGTNAHAGPARAGWDAAQESNFTLEGKVTQKNEGKLTVSTEENIIFHVRYDEKTDIRLKDGSQGLDKDLKTGLRVRVEGDLSESGEILAHKIQVV
jgi:hypothetical protein